MVDAYFVKPSSISLYKAVALIAAIAMCRISLAQSPDPDQSKPPEPVVKPAPPDQPESKPDTPARPATADDDLGRRLIRKTLAEAEEDVMDRAIRLMDESSRKLEIDFDPGDSTQALQKKIVFELDDAIKAAASRLRQSKSPRTYSTDRRRMSQPQREEGARSGGPSSHPDAPDDSTTRAAPPLPERELPQGPLQETRRGWGHLPQREREELIQGSGEVFLERYREWIDRYYQSLQERGE